MSHIVALQKVLNQTNERIASVFSYLALIMVLLMVANVLMRYVFATTLIWQQELVRFMYAMLFMACSGYCLGQNKHVRVDIFYQKYSTKTKAYVNLLGTLFLLIPSCVAIIYLSYDFIIDSWKITEHSAEYQGMQGVFLLKSFLWIFSGLLIIQGISHSITSLITLNHEVN